MVRRRSHAPALHVDATEDVDPDHQLAPVVADPDAVDVEPAPAFEAAPVFPTEADEAEATAQVLADDPHLTTHALARAIRTQLAANAKRAAQRQRALVSVVDDHAPIFPTEAHVGDLRDAIPTISDDELKAVLHAGYGAFVASIDAREPVLVAPTQE